MKKENVVLVALYDLDSFGVNTLYTVLKKAGFNAHSIFFKRMNPNMSMNFPSIEEINAFIRLIIELKPLFVGISLRSTNFKVACMLTEEIKKEVDTLVVWGGVHPTIRPEQCIKFADIVCIGEGEEPVVELATKLSEDEVSDNIQNLWIKRGNEIIKNDLRPLIEYLDTIPLPDFSNENKYLVENGGILPLPDPSERTSYGLMTSRGCPFSCTFCCNNILRKIYKGKGKYVRRRSVENVIEELLQAKKIFKNLKDIRFIDDVFTFDINWIRNFCNQYTKEVNIPFHCLCHPKRTDEEMIQLLKNAGLTTMIMGIQTGSEEFKHKYLERYESNEEIIRAAQILHKYKINCFYDIIMGNPLDTNEDRRRTLNLLLELPRPFELHTFTLTHFPKTKLTDLLLEKGLILENDVEDQKQRSSGGHFCPTLDLSRDKENLFWDNLYFLARKNFIPKQFIVWLSHSSYLKEHPEKLTFLLRLTSTNIYSVSLDSKAGMLRMYLILLLQRPQLLFEKNSWISLWNKIIISKPKVSKR